MRSGELRHKITIQAKGITQNEFGEPVETWSDVATVWASVQPLAGREYFQAQQVKADITLRVRMRYRSGIQPAMRLLFESRVFEIQAVIDPDERHRELELLCAEKVE